MFIYCVYTTFQHSAISAGPTLQRTCDQSFALNRSTRLFEFNCRRPKLLQTPSPSIAVIPYPFILASSLGPLLLHTVHCSSGRNHWRNSPPCNVCSSIPSHPLGIFVCRLEPIRVAFSVSSSSPASPPSIPSTIATTARHCSSAYKSDKKSREL